MVVNQVGPDEWRLEGLYVYAEVLAGVPGVIEASRRLDDNGTGENQLFSATQKSSYLGE